MSPQASQAWAALPEKGAGFRAFHGPTPSERGGIGNLADAGQGPSGFQPRRRICRLRVWECSGVRGRLLFVLIQPPREKYKWCRSDR